MSRVRKQEEFIEKKKVIINQSIKLLNEIGYNKFSINKVIEGAGLTKGAFFHYFSSKKELIDEIITFLQKPLLEVLEEIANDNTIEPKDKILIMANSVTRIKVENQKTVMQLINLLQEEDNKEIAEMINEKSIELFLPIYEKVLIEGNKRGQFEVKYPNGSAFMYFSLLASIRKEIAVVMKSEKIDQNRYEKLHEKVDAFEEYAHTLFSLDEKIKIIDKNMLKTQKDI